MTSQKPSGRRSQNDLEQKAWEIYLRLLESQAMANRKPEHVVQYAIEQAEMFLTEFHSRRTPKSDAA